MAFLTRRGVVLSAAAAGAAFGLDRRLAIFPSAQAQAAAHPLNPKGLQFFKHKVGGIEVTTVLEGDQFAPLDPAFVKNASVDDVKAALRAAGLPDDRRPNAYTVTFVTVGGRTVMFDSGYGAPDNPGGLASAGRLAENAKAAGIDLAKLSTIAVSHFHPDHIFGLFGKDNAQAYASIEIVVPEAEYTFWTDPAVIDKLAPARQGIARRVQATMPSWKNIRQVAADKDVVPGVRAVATPGHTPGHTSYLVSDGAAQVLVLGDVTNIPAVNLKNPGWHVVFDQDAALAEKSRRQIFDRAVADKLVCTGYHWGMPGMGTIAKDGAGYALTPVA